MARHQNQVLNRGTPATRSGPTSLSGESGWGIEAGGARRPPPTSSEILNWVVLLAKPGAPSLELLEAYWAGGPDATPTLRRGASGPLLPSDRP
eukprot:1812645-Pleurochrysis_carterae.AAC.3